jgi:predicted extracellular nuclease
MGEVSGDWVATPTFTPPAGMYSEPINVQIQTATEGATIYYSTTSISGPWVEYETSIAINETTTIWAYGAKEGMDNSSVAFATYTFPGEVVSIAEIRENFSQYDGMEVTIQAIVTIGVNSIQTGLTNAYVQDDSGRGINIYSSTAISDLARGNEVLITGTVGEYGDRKQIENPQVSVITTGNPEPTPLSITVSQSNQLDLEGTLLEVTGTIYELFVAGSGTNVNIEDSSGNQMTVRVWDTTNISLNELSVGNELTARGVGSVYLSKLQIVPGYQDQLGAGTGEDTTPPTITGAVSQSSTSVRVAFSEPVSSTTSTVSSNYTISGLSINSVAMDGSNAVLIETSSQTANETYTITINNVEDLAGNVIANNSTITFTGYEEGDYVQIADIRANYSQYEGQQVTVRAIVTIGVNSIQTGRTNAYVQDNSGRGIAVFDYDVINTIQRGNDVEITGTVGQYQGTMQIQNPQVTVLSTDNPEPTPLPININQVTQLNLEGTLLRVNGTIYDVFSAGGGTNLNIEDENGTQMTIRIWDTTGIDLSEYQVGYYLTAIGVGSVYNNKLQIVSGYQDQLREGGEITPDDITFDPETPSANEPITMIYAPTTTFDWVQLYWKKSYDLHYTEVEMDSVSSDRNVQYMATIPAQLEGTTIHYYLRANLDLNDYFVPVTAPDEVYQLKIPITSFKAILQVMPKPFNPFAGETMEITIGSTIANKAVLYIYNAEGKLMATPFNDFISSPTGTKSIIWNGRDKENKILPIGLYIAYLEVIKSGTSTKKSAKAPIVIGAPLK